MLAKEICFDEKVFPWVINSSEILDFDEGRLKSMCFNVGDS